MNAQTVSQILDALAARLSVPTAHLWGVLVRQARIEVFTTLVQVVLLWAVVYALARAFLKEHRKEQAKQSVWQEPSGLEVFLGVLAAVVGCFALIVTVVSIGQVGYLINPEYYALQKVLEALK